ncbi:hypothetical protein DMENIID0001_115160 [Sergentomyia squamirostris]
MSPYDFNNSRSLAKGVKEITTCYEDIRLGSKTEFFVELCKVLKKLPTENFRKKLLLRVRKQEFKEEFMKCDTVSEPMGAKVCGVTCSEEDSEEDAPEVLDSQVSGEMCGPPS